MGLFVSTVSSDVVINELGITLAHPTLDFQVDTQFSAEEIKRATSLTTAIIGGVLIWRKVAAGTVQVATDYDPDYVEIYNENTGSGLFDDQVVTQKDLNVVAQSASPGFGFGKSGNNVMGTWLQCETVPSNVTGRYVYIDTPIVRRVFVGNESVGTYSIQVWQHDGNLVNMVLLGTVTVTTALAGDFVVNWPTVRGKYLGLKISNGSVKNVVAGLELSGNNV